MQIISKIHSFFAIKVTINYLFAKNKYNEQDASLPCYEISQGHKYFDAVRLFSRFVPIEFSDFSIYLCKFHRIIPIVLLKFSSFMKNHENIAVNYLLEVAITISAERVMLSLIL